MHTLWIMCAYCHEINGVGAVGFMNRGFDTKVSAAFDDPLEDSPCVFCGMCVDVCPVGALVPKQSVGKGRPGNLLPLRRFVPTGTGCGLELSVKDNEIVGVKETLPVLLTGAKPA